jgi:hypothetical protein
LSSSDEYRAKAAEALEQLASATSEAERVRLRRSHGAYLKLATHGEEAARRASAKPPKRITPEKPKDAKSRSFFGLGDS